MAAYPSTLSALATPQPTDRLNSPSHSTLHQNENSAILEIQRFVGTDSSVVGTLVNDIRSPSSNGGGHVQTAVKGGTGQTTYTKGDTLIASSSSVLTKLAIGTTNQVLTVDPAAATGVKWAATGSPKVAIISSTGGTQNSTSEVILFSTSVLGSVIGTNNAIRFTAGISDLGIEQNATLSLRVKYGNNTVLLMTPGSQAGSVTGLTGVLTGMIVGAGTDTSQRAIGELTAVLGRTEVQGDAVVNISKTLTTNYGTSSVSTGATQNFIITAQFSGASAKSSIASQFLVVEKIT